MAFHCVQRRDLWTGNLHSNRILNRIGQIYCLTLETANRLFAFESNTNRIKRDVRNYRLLIPMIQSSSTLNNTGVSSLIELASLYTVPLSSVNGLSRLTTTSNGQARPIRKFSNRPMTFKWNWIGTADSNRIWISKLRRSLVQQL